MNSCWAPARARNQLGLLCALVAFFCGLAVPARGQEHRPPQISDLIVGFNRYYKIGYWAPIEVTITGGTKEAVVQLKLIVPDGEGIPVHYPTPQDREVRIKPGEQISVGAYAKIGQLDNSITAVLYAEDRKIASAELGSGGQQLLGRPLTSNQQLILNVGPPVGIGPDRPPDDEGNPRTRVVQIDDVGRLPTRWYGYDAVDVVVLATSKAELYRKLSAADARFKALEHWVRMGGRVILCVGREAEEILAPGAPLAALAPGRFVGSATLRDTSALEVYTGTSEPPRAQGDTRLKVPKLVDVRGSIEAFEGTSPRDLPLVIRAPHGFGQVVFVAVDLDRPPLRQWAGRQQLFNKLLDRSPQSAETEAEETAEVGNVGYNDLAGELRGALDQFEGVRLVPFSLVALLIVVYIALIGPVDYLIVKKLFKRMELTWITFPTIVALFSLGGYVLAYRLKGHELRVNQLDIVDFDVDGQMVRGTTWANFFSPQIDRFDLSLAPPWGSGRPDVLLSWMGLPGNGFGGMDSGGGSLLSTGYGLSPDFDKLEELPINVWSTKAIIGRWSAQSKSPVEADLEAQIDEVIAGPIISNLDFDLDECVLLFGRWAYPLGRLAAGAQVNLSRQSDLQTVETYFSGSQPSAHVSSSSQQTSATTLEVGRSARAMMFHNLVHGNTSTGLTNRYQGFVDLSHEVKMGRAVFVGRASAVGAPVLRDGQPLAGVKLKSATFYRFIIPVKPAATNNQ